MKFSIKDFFSKCDQIFSFLQIWSYLQKKSLMENFIFCAVLYRGSKQKLEAFSESYFSEKGFHRKLAPIKTLRISSKELSIIKSAGINSE